MGARDAEEMLEAAKEQAIRDERQIAQLQQKLDAIRAEHQQDAPTPAGIIRCTSDEQQWPCTTTQILDREDTP